MSAEEELVLARKVVAGDRQSKNLMIEANSAPGSDNRETLFEQRLVPAGFN